MTDLKLLFSRYFSHKRILIGVAAFFLLMMAAVMLFHEDPGGDPADFIMCKFSALMPMMQFSIAPWRILSPENMKIVKKYAALHEQYGDYFVRLAKTAAQTHEPIMRSLEYMFPGEGFERTNDCFMLGERLLVAPVLEKGKRERTLVLPRGKWKHCGKLLDGGREHTVAAELDFLPVFERAEERNSELKRKNIFLNIKRMTTP